MRNTLYFIALVAFFTLFIVSCRKSVPNGKDKSWDEPEEQPEVIETEPAILSAISQNISTHIKGYYEALPAKYNETTIRYPLILFFHGGGQYGNGSTDLPKVLKEGIPKLINAGTFPPSFRVNNHSYSFIVISPQFTRLCVNADIDALISHILNKYRIDTSRIYLSGFSLGAHMLSNYAAYKPMSLAAVTSMAGTLFRYDEELEEKCMAIANAKLPIWHTHNMDDAAWDYSESLLYINTINSFSPAIPPRFTSFEVGEGHSQHDSWTRVMNPEYREDGKNIYEWMLGYKR